MVLHIHRVYIGLEWLQFYSFDTGALYATSKDSEFSYMGNHSCTGIADMNYGRVVLRKLQGGLKIRCMDCGFAVPVDIQNTEEITVPDICVSLKSSPVTAICGDCWGTSSFGCKACSGNGIPSDQPITYITMVGKDQTFGEHRIDPQTVHSPFAAITVFPMAREAYVRDLFKESRVAEFTPQIQSGDMEAFFRNFLPNAILVGNPMRMREEILKWI